MTEEGNGKAFLSNRDLILEMRVNTERLNEKIDILVANQGNFVTKKQVAGWFAAVGTFLLVVSSILSVVLAATLGS